jgi:hypothetical protein
LFNNIYTLATEGCEKEQRYIKIGSGSNLGLKK